MEIKERISQTLAQRRPRRFEGDYLEAAVLISIQDLEQGPHFLLTRRTQSVATHKGQISFPGGTRDLGDLSLTDTALRETEEEIGLPKSQIDLIGAFDDYFAVTDHLVRVFVGLLPPDADFHPNDQEVAYLLQVPFHFFRTCRPKIEYRRRLGEFVEVLHFDFQGDDIWGLTARIISDFLNCLDA